MKDALTGDFSACMAPLPERFEVQVRLNQHTMAFKNSFYPGAKLLDPKTIGFSSDDYFEVLRFFHLYYRFYAVAFPSAAVFGRTPLL